MVMQMNLEQVLKAVYAEKTESNVDEIDFTISIKRADDNGAYIVVKSKHDDLEYIVNGHVLWSMNGTEPLSDREASDRMHRIHQDVMCQYCNKPAWQHPDEDRYLDWNGFPFLKRMCSGILAKL